MTIGIRTRTLLAALLLAVPADAQQRVTLPAKDRPLALKTRTLFQVGAVEGADYENFGLVTDVAFDARGNLYVLDTGAKRVVMFDTGGKFVRTIGREGGGPGEFTMPSGLTVLDSGELVVNDGITRGSLHVFSSRGDFVRTIPIAADLGRITGRLRATSGNAIIAEAMPIRRLTEGGRLPQRITLPPRSVARLTLGDSVTGRRLFNTPPRELNVGQPQTSTGGQLRIPMSMPAYEPSLLWSQWANGGVAVLNTERYRISLTDAQGGHVGTVLRGIEPRKVTDADKKRFLEQQKQGTRNAAVMAFSSGRAAAGAATSGARVPSSVNVSSRIAAVKAEDVAWNDVIPVIAALGTDSWGRLWVQRYDASSDGHIDLIDARLRYLGTLSKQAMPRAFGPDGRVAYIEMDDLDVQHVIVRQLRQ